MIAMRLSASPLATLKGSPYVAQFENAL